MNCSNCGNEVQENWTRCPECGVELENATNVFNDNVRSKKPIYKKWWFWVLIILGIGVIGILSEDSGMSSEEAEKVIDKLSSFTEVERGSDKYCFVYDNWVINYTEANEFVRFDYSSVSDFLVYAFGYDCMNDGSIGYDFDENEIRIYVTAEVDEGTLSIINYNIDDEEFTINLDGERYTPSDELLEALEEYDVVDKIQDEIDEFEDVLKENGLSIDDVSGLKYQNVNEYFD